MTETLNMTIAQLIRALEDAPQEGGASPSAQLRARLMADFSEALSSHAVKADDAAALNDLAEHLEGLSGAAERDKLIGILAQHPQSLAALQSAAAFLADLEPEPQPVAAATLAEAMAVFAPQVAHGGRLRIVAARGFNWQAWGAMAAVLLVGIVGGAQFWQFEHGSGPAQMMHVAPKAAASKALGGVSESAPMYRDMPPASPAAALRSPDASGAAQGDCDAAATANAEPSATAGGGVNHVATSPIKGRRQAPCKSATSLQAAPPVPAAGVHVPGAASDPSVPASPH
jgi:hypothetical protein